MTRTVIAILLLTIFAVQTPAASAQERYQQWRNPDAANPAGPAQDMIGELNKLIDAAEESRAADPLFLRDLRDLIRRYQDPWPDLLLADTFADGDFTNDPAWQVIEGRFRIESNFGLRGSFADVPPRGGGTDEDAARQLLGAILNQALGDGQGRTTATRQARRASIHAPVDISNTFVIEFELTSWRADTGVLSLGPYFGGSPSTGYRLVYRSGATPSLSLERQSRTGTRRLTESAIPVTFEDKRPHMVRWSRDSLGEMVVSVDGTEMLGTSDDSLGDPFSGFVLTNTEGDYILRRIEIRGTR